MFSMYTHLNEFRIISYNILLAVEKYFHNSCCNEHNKRIGISLQ